MAKRSNNDLLANILKELDMIISSNSKRNASAPTGGGQKLPDALALDKATVSKESSAMGGTMLLIAEAVKSMAKIDDKQVKRVINVVKELTNVVSSIKITKDEAESLTALSNAITVMSETFGKLTDNFFLSFFKFSPAKGKIIGKRMAKFFKNIFDAFELEKVFDYLKDLSKQKLNSFISITDTILKLFDLKASLIIKVSMALAMIPERAGKRVAGFFSPIILMVRFYIPASPVFRAKLKSLAFLFEIFGKIKIADVLVMVMMGTLLNPLMGRRIGMFIRALVTPLAKISLMKIIKAILVVTIFLKLMKTLITVLLISVLIAAIVPLPLILGAFMIMGALVLFTIATMKLLSNRRVMASAKGALWTVLAFSLLIQALTFTLVLAILIPKIFKWTEILAGMAVLTGMILFCIGTIFLLSLKKIQTNSKKAFVTVGIFVIMLLAISLIAFIFIPLGKHWDDVLKGGLVVGVIIAACIGLVYLLGSIKKSTIIKGAVAAVLIVGVLVMITLGVGLFMGLLAIIGAMSAETIGIGSLIVLAIIAAVTAITFAASLCLMGPQAAFFLAGVAALTLISAVIITISLAISAFAGMIALINKVLTVEAVENATNMIVGDGTSPSLVSCIAKMIDGLSNIGVIAAAKVAAISMLLLPVFLSMSMFVNLVQKMAKLEIIDHFDENGKPVYRPMKMSEFTEAADTLVTAFTNFITTLVNGFSDKSNNIKLLGQILEALFPTGSIFKSRPSFKKLVDALSKFVDVVQKLAVMSIADEWDENGNPKHYRKLSNDEFIAAANTMTIAFTSFISGLLAGFGEDSNNAILMGQIIEALFPTTWYGKSKPSFKTLMDALSKFVDVIVQLSSMSIPDEWNEDGTPKHYRKILDSEITGAASTLCSSFTTFITKLQTEIGLMSEDIADTIEDIADSGIDKLMNSLGGFMKPVLDIAAGKMKVGDEMIEISEAKLKSGARIIASALSNLLTGLKGAEDWADEDDIEFVAESMEAINKCLSSYINVLTKAMKPEVDITASTLKIIESISSVFTLISTQMGAIVNSNIFVEVLRDMTSAIESYTHIKFHSTATEMDEFSQAIENLNKVLDQATPKLFATLKTMKLQFDSVAASVRSLANELNHLLRIERDWKSVNNSELYKRWEEMFLKQQQALKDAAKTYEDAAANFANKLEEQNVITVDIDNLVEKITQGITNADLDYNVTYSGNKITAINR